MFPRGRNYGRGNRAPYAQGQRGSYMLMWLLMGLAQQISQLPVKPPVTLALIGANVFVHLSSPVLFGTIDMGVRSICLNPRVIISSFMSFGRLEVARLLLSGFVHGDDMHLYYNMVSLLWKGVHLEGAIGSAAFAQLCAFALIVSHTLVVLLAWTLSQFGYIRELNTCAVGFSAVLFALKVVWNSIGPTSMNVYGFAVPSKYAAWLELLLIQLLVPNASFTGHLCGIAAGMLYLLLDRYNVFAALAGANTWPRAPSYTYARGTTRTQRPASTIPDDDSEEREVHEAIRRSLVEGDAYARAQAEASTPANTAQNGYGRQPHDPDVARARRLQRFTQNTR